MSLRGALRWIVLIPLLLFLILFLLSNRQTVTLELFPTDLSVELAMSVAILAALGIGFLMGGLIVWFGTIGLRRAARRAEEKVHLMETKQPGQALIAPR